MTNISPPIKQRFFNAAGSPLASGKLYTYAAGTTTPKTTYADSGTSTPNANPVILDSGGYADVWLGSGAYKFVLKDSADVTQWTVDNVQGTPITTKGDLIVGDANGYPTRLAVGADNTVLQADSSQSSGVKWAANPDLTVLSKSANYSALVSDDFIACDATGGAFTITFPAANTATNKVLIVEKTDSGTNAITLSGTGLTTAYLKHQYEARAFVSDGSTWWPLWANLAEISPLAKTGAYTVVKTDDFIVCDATSAAFTLTFPDATTCKNKMISAKKTDSSFNAVTISGTGMTTNYLMTQNETVTFYSDGSNWQQLWRKTDTPWTTFTQSAKGSTGDPTKGTGGTDSAKWRRVGDSIEVSWVFTQTIAGSAGTGNYYFPIPNSTGWTIDSNKTNTGAYGAVVGYAELDATGYHGPVLTYSSTAVGIKIFNDTNNAVTYGAALSSFSTATLYIYFQYSVPITNFSA